MNTCKAALRILHARKLYVIIYLVWIGAMMLGISWQIMHASRNADSTTYQPSAAQVAIIDRDADADGLASSLRSYLSTDSEIVDIADDDESLQQAVASNYVDLIAIIPKGFAERYQRYLNETDGSAAQPAIETVVSYTSGSGSLAQLKVNEFLSLTRTSYLGLPSGTRNVSDAAQAVLDIAKKDIKESSVAVIQAPSNDTDTVKPAASAFASTIKTGLYPLLLVMPICTFLVIGTFNESEIRRRLYASPKRSVSLEHAAGGHMLHVRPAGMHRLHRRDLPADDDGGSAVRRTDDRQRRTVVRLAAGLYVNGHRLRFPAGIGRSFRNGREWVRQRIRPAHHVHVGHVVRSGHDASPDDHDRQAAARMVAVRVHRQRVRTRHGFEHRRGLWRMGVVDRSGGVVRRSVRLPRSGPGPYPSHPSDLGLPCDHAAGEVRTPIEFAISEYSTAIGSQSHAVGLSQRQERSMPLR